MKERPQFRDEGLKNQEKMTKRLEMGKPLIENSNLSKEDEPISKEDIETARKLIQTISPVTIENHRLHAHLQIAAKFSRKIGEELKKVNPKEYGNLNIDELEILALFHDIGRFVTHKFYRNDLIGSLFLRKIGIRDDLCKKLTSVKKYAGKGIEDEEATRIVNKLTLEQKIIELADVCGKRNPDGDIPSFEDVMKYHRSSRARFSEMAKSNDAWPSERIISEDIIILSEKVYRMVKGWLKNQGIDVENLRQEILENEKKSEIKSILFDVGGVLIPETDAAILDDFVHTIGVKKEVIKNIWDQLVPSVQTGIISEEDFWQELSRRIGKPLPTNYQELWVNKFSTNVTDQMRDIIKRLKARGYDLIIFSDTISSHRKKLEETGVYALFQGSITSLDIKTTKKNPDAFSIATLRLWLPPQACVFIDNRIDYIAMSKEKQMKGIHYESDDKLEKDLQQQKLI